MKKIDLEKLNTEIETFINERDWDKFHSVKNLSMGLSVECSELLEIFQWMPEDESNQIKNDPKTFTQVEDELADIFYFLNRLVNKTGVDLESAVLRKLQKNREKYPIEKSKGNSKKYNNL